MNQGLPTLEQLQSRHAQMFPVLTEAQIARVREFGTERSYAAGEMVFRQGDYETPFFVVLAGELEIVHPDGQGREERVVLHTARHFTGEATLLSDRRALVSGRAKSDLRVLVVPRDGLHALIQTDAELSELLMRAFILRRVGLLTAHMGDAVLIGSKYSAATLRVQEFLTRNSHPYRYLDVDKDPEVQSMLDGFHVTVADIPVLICRFDRVLKNPTDAEIADCLGFNASFVPDAVYQLVVCGAGPGGLAAAVYAASEGLDVLVIEASAPGGQAASSSKIENYLGFPTGVSGQALAARALTQAEKFGAKLTVARGAKALHCGETPIRIDLEGGTSVRARAVVIATGARYRKLDLPNLARFEGVGIYYAATFVEAQRCSEEDILIVGGGNSAGQAATFLARGCRHVHMLIRGPDLAASMSRYLIRRIEETPNITLHRRTEIVALEGDSHLERVHTRDGEGVITDRKVRHVFSMTGASPNTDWLDGCLAVDKSGFIHTGDELTKEVLSAWPLERPPYLFETSRPRVFAVGDVRASSVKRVASAVGEGSVCVQLVHKVLAE